MADHDFQLAHVMYLSDLAPADNTALPLAFHGQPEPSTHPFACQTNMLIPRA